MNKVQQSDITTLEYWIDRTTEQAKKLGERAAEIERLKRENAELAELVQNLPLIEDGEVWE